MLKQVIVIRKDLDMSLGKSIAQSCHACLGSYEKTSEAIKKAWKGEGEKKVVLEVNSKKEILQLHEKAKELKLSCFLVKDAGLTELEPGTVTALGIGPDKEEIINKVTGSVKLL
jgi:PTH2 family peptidyl-tRNA hydrolase